MKVRRCSGRQRWLTCLLFVSACYCTGGSSEADVTDANSRISTTPTTTSTSSTPWLSNSKVIIDSVDDIRPIQSDDAAQQSSIIFFSASLSIFAAIGIVIFFRKCVRCPARRHTRRRHLFVHENSLTAAHKCEQNIHPIASSPVYNFSTTSPELVEHVLLETS